MGNDLATLREKTVLCRVSGSAYGMTRVDRLVKARAVQDGALPNDTKVMVPTAPELAGIHADLVAAQYAARSVLRELSMPYGDDEGWRVLPHSLMADFLKNFATHKGKFNTLLSDLKAKLLPVMVTQGHSESVSTAVAHEELDARAAKVTSAYTLTWRMQDYPSGQFAGLAEKTAQALKERHEGELARVVAATREYPLSCLAQPIQHMHDRVALHDEAERARSSRKISLRASILTNIGKSATVASAFNIYEDATVNAIISEARSMADMDLDLLREDASFRGGALVRANTALRWISDICRSPLGVFVAAEDRY